MEKINIAELLKDCPTGMELDCPMYENLYFDRVNEDTVFPILAYAINNSNRTIIPFTKHGCYNRHSNAKCVIFPKGKTSWEGFVPPCQFKDGDIIYNQDINAIAIFHKQINDNTISHCFLNVLGELKICHYHSKFLYDWKLATEEKKKKLFDAIKANGYRWNADTKTLEKLVEPIFKVGDRIKSKEPKPTINTITQVYENHYELDDGGILPLDYQYKWELVSNKFDITTLKPFDKVLVRDNDKQEWVISFFSHCNGLELYKYSCINGSGYVYCIPYEHNEHLLGTTNDCDDFYKTWEK